VVDLAAGPGFTRRLLVLFGLASMTVAAAFLWSPSNFKRMLAYSSVEHLGLVCLGLGFGGIWGVTGAALHLANHALAKSVLFILSGRIRDAYGTVEIPSVRGLLTAMPVTGRGFVIALLALLGLPPFGLFVSELMILGAGFQEGWGLAAALGLVLLLIAFGGLLRAMHQMAYGSAAGVGAVPAARETLTWKGAAPIAAALSFLVLTGTAWPPGLAAALERLAAVMGG
jgi:hydrogenase-4 component F